MFVGIGIGLYQTASSAVLSGAASLLSGETDGLAFDFTDFSARIKDTSTPANEINSTGYVTSGSLVGPGAKLTYTSPLNKMCLQSTGYYTYGAHNLYINSATPANQSITVVSGASYAVTITGSVSITASGAATGTWTSGTTTFTAATGTLTLGSTSGTGTVHVYRTPAVTDFVATGASPVYALPYTYDTSGTLEGILVEEARTNRVTYSRPQSTYWDYNTTGTLTENATTSPTGQTNGSLSAEGDSSAFLRRASSDTITAAQHAMTVYLKYYNSQWVRVIWASTISLTNGIEAWFDIQNGAIGTTATRGTGWSVSSTSITLLENGWCRCTCIVTAGGTTVVPAVMSASGNGSTTRNNVGGGAGVGTGMYIQFAQVELGAYATSPIITYGSSVTRASDNITIASTSYPHSATVNSGLVQYIPQHVSSAAIALKWSDGTANEVVSIGHSASAVLGLTVTDGGAAQTAPLTDGTATKDATETLGFSWKANDFLFSDNGATAVADTSGTLPTVTTLHMGGSGSVILKKVLVVPVEKSAAEVAAYGATS